MAGNLLDSLEPYIIILIIIHAIISLLLAIVLSTFLRKRFIRDTKEVELKDAARLKAIVNESFIFKLLFNVALHKHNRKTNIIFMFIFNFSMPIIGYISSMWITWYLKNVSYKKVVANTNILNLDEFGISFLKVERIFGEASMSDLMLSEHAPKSKKLKALSTLAHNATPANLKIIRQTLGSTDDEIRMFGYAIINKAEKALNIKINEQLDILHDESNMKNEELDMDKRAKAAKEIAPLYWEMVYTELSHESLKDNFLEEVTKYIWIAVEYYMPDIIYLRERIEESELKVKETRKQNLEKKRKRKEIAYEDTHEFHVESLKVYKSKLKKNIEICTKLYILMGRAYMGKKEYENAKIQFDLAQKLHNKQLR